MDEADSSVAPWLHAMYNNAFLRMLRLQRACQLPGQGVGQGVWGGASPREPWGSWGKAHGLCHRLRPSPPRHREPSPAAVARQRLARPGGRRVTSTDASWRAVDHHVPRAAGQLAAPRRMLHNARAHRARRRGGPRAMRRATPPTALADGDDMLPDAHIPSRGWAPAIASLPARGPRGAAFPLACRTPLVGGV